MKRLTIEIDETLLKAIKKKALDEDKTVKILITELILKNIFTKKEVN